MVCIDISVRFLTFNSTNDPLYAFMCRHVVIKTKKNRPSFFSLFEIFCLIITSEAGGRRKGGVPLFPSLSSGLTKDGDDSENADSLEEVLDILAQEGSDWFYGFFTFLHDVVTSPVNRGVMEEEEEDEEEGDEDRQAASQREGGAASDDMVEGVILDLLNQ